MTKNIHVAAAVVINDNKILIAQLNETRKNALMWEFPGGKIEANETPQECLVREFIEELGIDIEVKDFVGQSKFEYEFGLVTLEVFLATSENRNITKLTDHKKVAWIEPKQLEDYQLTPPDKAISGELLKRLQSSFPSLF